MVWTDVRKFGKKTGEGFDLDGRLVIIVFASRTNDDKDGRGKSLQVTHHRPTMSMESVEASPPQIRGRTS
jgi:hypothetical protein